MSRQLKHGADSWATQLAFAAGHPSEEVVVEWIHHAMKHTHTVIIKHRKSQTVVYIDDVTDDPQSLDGLALGDLFNYVKTPGKAVEISYETAVQTIAFLKETI